MRSVKEEALGRIILFGERSLRNVTREFIDHYHEERNHQGLGNELIEPEVQVTQAPGELQRAERLGGLINYYHRAA